MRLPRPRLAHPRIALKSSRYELMRSYSLNQQDVPRKPVPFQSPSVSSQPPSDPRPRWIFSSAAFLRIVLVPAGLAYAVFYHDFGEEEHVFMPPRRWLQRQRESFFSLSPAERGLVTDVQASDGERR